MSLSSGDSPSTLAAPPRGKERCSKGAGSRKGEQGPRTEASKKFDKGGSFSGPAAAELESEDD